MPQVRTDTAICRRVPTSAACAHADQSNDASPWNLLSWDLFIIHQLSQVLCTIMLTEQGVPTMHVFVSTTIVRGDLRGVEHLESGAVNHACVWRARKIRTMRSAATSAASRPSTPK